MLINSVQKDIENQLKTVEDLGGTHMGAPRYQ